MGTNDILDQLNDFIDTPYRVDFELLLESETYIKEIVSFLLGIVAWIIAVLMTCITMLDVAYISIPVFQDTVRRRHWDGSNSHRMKFVSRDAVESVNDASINGGSAMSIYIKKRFKTYIICATVLTIILMGTQVIVPLITKIVVAIINGVGKVFSAV